MLTQTLRFTTRETDFSLLIHSFIPNNSNKQIKHPFSYFDNSVCANDACSFQFYTQSRTLYIQTRHLCNVYSNRRTMTMNLIESMIEKNSKKYYWLRLNVTKTGEMIWMCCLKKKQNKRMMHDLICVGMPVNSLQITTFEMLFKIMKSMKIVLYF